MQTALTVPFLCLLSLAAVQPTPAQQPAPAPKPAVSDGVQQAAPKLDAQRYDHFGDGIVEGVNLQLADVLKDPAKHTGKAIRLEGPVTAVCQKKGCWMHLGAQQPPVMVKFKDYAFFVPKDASGRSAVLEGTMTLVQETVEQTRHYLEDAGRREEAAKVTEGRKLYTFMASGVAITKPGQKLDARRYDHFGDGIVEGPNLPLADVLKDPAKHTGKAIRLEGPVTAVCQKKGCWMHLGAQQPPVMVKFKDYAFFVPKDASGRSAVLEGTMTLVQETVEQTRHYLEDAGRHEEAAKVTEGRKLYTFMASGVAIEKPRG